MSRLLAAAFDTPFGELNVIVSPEDSVVRGAGLRPLGEVERALSPEFGRRGVERGELGMVADAVAGWLDGDTSAVDEVVVAQDGGPFFQEVWDQMRAVPAGRTVSYQELAEMCGRPRAMRAVGTACARNTIALFVPCHRVIKSGGRLGSYGFGGIEIKAGMLEHEGVKVAFPGPDARVTEPDARVAEPAALTPAVAMPGEW